MDTLPQDPNMLLSIINMKLRDTGMDLDQLCDDLDINPDELKERLREAGFEYSPQTNRFA